MKIIEYIEGFFSFLTNLSNLLGISDPLPGPLLGLLITLLLLPLLLMFLG